MSELYQSCVNIVSNQPAFIAGGIQKHIHAWTEITTNPFVLDAAANCHIDFNHVRAEDISNTRPPRTFPSAECQIIDFINSIKA